MARKLKPNQICLSELKARGWTDDLISRYLPEPMLVTNPYYKTSNKMRLWNLDEVEMVEDNTAEFKARVAKLNKRKADKERKLNIAHREQELKIQQFADDLNAHNPAMDYPNARKLYRHFILNVGPTNSGKTYESIQALKIASSGVYLAPLRLLAMEIQDRLLSEGVLCSMVTGEEEYIVENSTIMSSTVEKINLKERYEIGVIDECQMIADDTRGGSWTRAILGLAAETIYLCMSSDAVDICVKLIEMCGDTYEIHECHRSTPLIFQGTIGPKSIKKNDALILFSRKKVLRFAEDIKMRYGLTPSVVYGALPYRARKQQVDLYLSGQTDVIVATDAIGMGMNLPIQRVVFIEDEKFDGLCTRPLSNSEVKQIAGRAGRRGLFEEGYVVGMEGIDLIGERLNATLPTIEKAHIPFPEEALNCNSEKLSTVLKDWMKIKYPPIFRQQNVLPILERVLYLEKAHSDLSRIAMLKLSMVMFDEKDEELMRLWRKYVGFYVSGSEIWMPKINEYGRNLHENEHTYKELDLFYSFHKTMNLDFNHRELVKRKERLIELINDCLMETNKRKSKSKKPKGKNKRKHKYHNYDIDDFQL